MKFALLLLLSIAATCRAELVLEVTPELFQPGITPSFGLNCALLENEEAKVVSLSIFRRTNALGNLQIGPAQRIATITSLSPNLPSLSPGFEQLKSLGQIAVFQSPLGSYLKLMWPSPTVEELGLYTCEAVLMGPFGRLGTMIAQARVSSAEDPVVDNLLVSLNQLEQSLAQINSTVVELQGRVDNITAVQEELVRERAIQATAVSVFEGENVVTAEPATTEAAATTLDPTDQNLLTLTALVQQLESKMDAFSGVITAVQQRIAGLEKGPVESVAPTPAGQNYVMNFFLFGNSTYFLITGNHEFSTETAQAVCESENLILAEIQNQEELNIIEDNIAPMLLTNQLVFVGGRRPAGQTDWVWQGTRDKVTFFSFDTADPIDPTTAQCLALTRSTGLVMTSVNCGALMRDVFFLCEDQF